MSHDLQLPALGFGFMNPAEVRSAAIIGTAIQVGPGDSALVDTASPTVSDLPTSVVKDTSSVVLLGEPNSRSHSIPSLPTTSVAITETPDIPSSFESRTFTTTSAPCQGMLDGAMTGPSRIGNPAADPTSRYSPGPTEHLHRKPCPLESGGSVVKDLVNPPAEESVHPLVEQLVHPISEVLTATTTFPRHTHQTTTLQFSLSLFQRPTLLDTLVQRLQTKRALVYSWRIADQFSERRDTPPTRYRLKDLDSSQIYEYLKSGGKSNNALRQPAKEKVGTPLPLFRRGLAYITQVLSTVTESDIAGSPLLVATARQKKFTPPCPSLYDLIAKSANLVRFSVYCRCMSTD